MIKIGINGFGRIGRFVFRSTVEAENAKEVQVVAINDLCPVDYMAYMLKYDTMHGQFDGTIEADVEKSELIVNGNHIRVTAERDPENLKWDEVGAEYVVESTGLFLAYDKAEKHLKAGAKYVVLLLLLRLTLTVTRLICSFAVLTLTSTMVRRSFLTLLVQQTAWLLSLRY